MCNEILGGQDLSVLPFVDDVQVVFDVGANCGAATVYFARHYPDAEIHSFEPGSEPRAFLERNAADYANAHVHPIGLSADRVVPLTRAGRDRSSVVRRPSVSTRASRSSCAPPARGPPSTASSASTS